MPAHEILFSIPARADLESLSPDVALRIGRKIKELGTDPSPRGDTVKRLQGFQTSVFRLRIGDYRAPFQIRGGRVEILRILHRSELDRGLRELINLGF